MSIICAGRERQFSLEDAACAGRYVRHVTRRLSSVELNDGALACMLLDRRYGDRLGELFDDAEHARALRDSGFAEDLRLCASVDAFPVVPVYHDRQITMIGPARVA